MQLASVSSCRVCALQTDYNHTEGYCVCGLGSQRIDSKVEQEISRQMLFLTAIIAVVCVPWVIFISQYHGFGTEIIGLKIGSALGMTSARAEGQLAELCARIGRDDCARSAYRQAASKHAQNLELWLAWAKFEARKKNPSQAVVAYAGYFANGGTDQLEHYRYAKALQDTGKAAEAIVEYQKMLEAEPETLQVTVAQNLVHLLMEQKRLDEALQAIQRFQGQGHNGGDYLNEELAKVRKELKDSGSSARPGSAEG